MTQRTYERRLPPYPGRPVAAPVARVPASSMSVTAMGLTFPNALGLAAGFDRTGELVPSLLTRGFGHVEVGTVTPMTGLAGALRRSASPMRIGINIGSARPGLDERVVADYVAMLEKAVPLADYVVANLSRSDLNRDGNTAGVDGLVRRLAVARDVRAAVGGRRVPLLLKIEAGRREAPFPAAVMAAKVHGLDGVVLVSESLFRLRAIAEYLDGLAVVSVSGVRTADDVRVRLAAGAALVQLHRVFADGGAARIRRILKDLATPAESRE